MCKYVKFFFSVIFTAIIFFNFAKCSAEDLRFIDANGNTGYYVDASTIRVESDSVFYVDFDIIRADINQMDIISLKINHWQKIYQVMSIKTLSYDERTELRSDNQPRNPSSYAEKSVIGEIVHFVLTGSMR